MPKDHRRIRSQSYYRPSPVTTPTTAHYPSAQYAPISSRPPTLTSSIQNTYYAPSMSQQQYSSQVQPTYPNGGPVQHPLSSAQYAPIPLSSAPPSIRPSSGAWNPTDDQTLMAARAQGMNWAPIQQAYFPTKTPNACRKRHERLMERRSADDWDGLKLETLAKNYMGMRREIWSGLASVTGEKWNVVEQKCMSQGLKNLQTAARSHARRERMLDTSGAGVHGMGGGAYDHTDDSGIGIDDLEAEYDADGASERSGSSAQSAGHSYVGYQDQRQQYHQGNNGRLPSMDMGIDAIINRPGGSGR